MFAEIFSMNSNLDDWGICSPAFPSWVNMRLHNVPVILNLVKKVDSSEVTCPGCIAVVALKNCESELSYVLAHCNQGPEKSWKVLEFDLLDFWKILRNVLDCPGILLWEKVFLITCCLFSKYFIMVGFQSVYNNVSIVIYISEENCVQHYVQLNVQKEMNKC